MVDGLTKDEEQVQYNLGSQQLMLIGDLLHQASLHYLQGKHDKWYFDMKNIKFQIISRLSVKDREALKEKEAKISRALCLYNKDNQNRKCIELLARLVEEYDVRIKELLELKGFLIPTKENTSLLWGKQLDPDDE